MCQIHQNLWFINDTECFVVTHKNSVTVTRMIEQSTDFIVPARPREWQMFSKLLAPGRKLTMRYVKLSDLQNHNSIITTAL